MGKTAILLMILTLISKVTGLVREKFFAYFLGTSDLLDIYNTSSSIPLILFSFISASLVAVFIPIYQGIVSESGVNKAHKFTSNLVNIMFIVATLFIIFIYITAPLLVKLFAPAYVGEKLISSINFTRIMSITIYASIFSSVFIAYLRIKNKFLTAEFPGIIMNFFYVISLLISYYFNNIYLLPILFVVSDMLKYMFFPRAIKKTGYKHQWILNFKDKHIMEVITMSIPIMISIAAIDISTISDQSMATIVMQTGGLSIMRFASLVLTLINGVIVVSITTSIYPSIAKYANEKRIGKLKSTILDGNVFSFIVIIPSIVGVMILSEPLIRLLFQGGNFDSRSSKLTADVLIFYIPALLGQTITQMISRGYYSLKNTITPIIITIVQVVLNILLNNILGNILGLQGLALATTISSLFAGLVSIILFNKKYGNMANKKLINSITKISFASIIMGIATYFTYHSLVGIHYLLAFLAAIIVSMVVYLIAILSLRIPHVIKLINIIYKKYKNR